MRSQRGDTIIEVLIVLAILGSALSISFATAAHSLLAIRSTQQNSTAAEILQEQLESVRVLAYSQGSASSIFQHPGSFCIDTTSTALPVVSVPNPTPFSTGYPAQCIVSSAPYYIAISYQPISDFSNPTVGTFTLTAHWNDLSSEGIDSATLDYRPF